MIDRILPYSDFIRDSQTVPDRRSRRFLLRSRQCPGRQVETVSWSDAGHKAGEVGRALIAS
jgi:hypothetical protein